MSKNPNKRTKPARRDEPMNGAMKFFLAGCVAELYLLLIRRFYVNADSDLQRITWYDSYLWVLVGVGAAVLVAGVVCAFLWAGQSEVSDWLSGDRRWFLYQCSSRTGPLEYVIYDAFDGCRPCCDAVGHFVESV